MRWPSKIFRKRKLETQVDSELRFHVEQKTAELIAKGVEPAEARRRAMAKLGGIEAIKQEWRESRATYFLESFLGDIRYALRMLRKSPGFTIVAIVTLALGIGANTAIFSLLDAALLRPLPYSQPGTLFRLYPTTKFGSMVATSYPDFRDWRSASHAFKAMAGYYSQDFNLTGAAEPERLSGLRITPGLFALLGVHPIFGRGFSRSDGKYVAVLSYRLCQRRFGGNRLIVGKPIYLDDRAYTVVGILPPRFYFPPREYMGGLTAQVFVPAIPNVGRGWNYVRVIGRLAPGVTVQQAQVEMDTIAAGLSQSYPGAGHGTKIELASLDRVATSGMRETAWMLLGAVGFVLLIVCANLANLLLARVAIREREIAIRSAVGATRARLVRQLLTEGLLLSVFGGALGVALADWLLPLLARMVPKNTMFFTRVHDVGLQLNHTVLAFAALSAAVSALLFGLLPAWKATKPAQTRRVTLRTGKTRAALIALEVSLALVLLAGAGLMMKSLIRLMDVDVGFRTKGLLTLDVSLPARKYYSAEKQSAFFRTVMENLRSLPAVVSAGAVTDLPLTRNDTWNGFGIPGTHLTKGIAGYHSVSPDYFHTMGIPLLRGRELSDSDSAQSPLVGVISLHMAKKYWPHQNPVGASIIIEHVVETATPKGTRVQFKQQQLEIVGVVGDVRQLGLDTPPASELYMPYPQWPSNEMSLIVRTKSAPSSLIPPVEKAIWAVDPDQPVTAVKTMDQWAAAEEAARRFVLELIGTFALVALLLAAVGIYGVISYSVMQRMHEIGIRIALGAHNSDVLRMVVGQGLGLALTGVGIGIVGALGLTRFLSSLLYGVKPTDPVTFIVVSLTLTAVALIACYIPARRAARVDPIVALRHE